MHSAAHASGLTDVDVEEIAIDVGVTEPEQLVDYRFGQAQFSEWLACIGPAAVDEARQHALDAIRALRPYLPIVVFLSASVSK
jgi:hypothetical protein